MQFYQSFFIPATYEQPLLHPHSINLWYFWNATPLNCLLFDCKDVIHEIEIMQIGIHMYVTPKRNSNFDVLYIIV